MMNKYWLLICFALIVLLGCENDSKRRSNLISWVPENSSIIIKTSSLEGLKSVLKNNILLNGLSEYSKLSKIQNQLDYLKYLKPVDNVLMSFGKSTTDSLQIALITNYHKDLFNLDSVADRTIETYTYNKLTISKITLGMQVLYSTTKDSIFFASNDQILTENAFNDDRIIDAEFETLYQTANSDKSVSILFNSKHQKLVPSFFSTDALNQAQLTKYMLLDADLSQDEMAFNGIVKAADSSKSLINVFKNTVPQENRISKICPPNADGFLSFTFNNYTTFSDNLSKFNNQKAETSSMLFETVTELGVVYRGSEQAIIISSLDASAMSDLLLTQNAVETFRDIDIFPFDNPALFNQHFAPFITYKNASKYANVDDFFVFTDSDGLMKDIISSYHNNATLFETAAFKSIMDHLSDESSLFEYLNDSRLNQLLNTNFSQQKVLKIDAFNASAIQFIQDSDFAHINAIIKKNKGKTSTNSVSEDVSVTLDNDLLTDPQLVKNHMNNQMEIVVQDVKNNFYLISNDGKVLWKKQLEGKLLGNVAQIDMYKNGRLQLAFATSNRVYVLDRNGKDVSPFPLKFKDNITQPLSVFDYDKKRDYRLMVTQGNTVLLYDQLGNSIKSFTYNKADNTINTQPRHYRIGNKDYIVFVQGKELEILDRVGKTRIKVKNNVSFSGNEILVYENKFTTTTVKGDVVQIDENGKLISLNLNLGEKHAIASTGKTLVTLSDNILHIKSNRVELDFGIYTAPKIFYLNDKIYISVTDLQTKKVYLFDSLGKEINNFPVFGNSSIELGKINNGKGLEFVTKGDSNSILLYHLN